MDWLNLNSDTIIALSFVFIVLLFIVFLMYQNMKLVGVIGFGNRDNRIKPEHVMEEEPPNRLANNKPMVLVDRKEAFKLMEQATFSSIRKYQHGEQVPISAEFMDVTIVPKPVKDAIGPT